MKCLQLLNIMIEFLFLLLHTMMVHLMEIALLPQLIVGGLSVLRYDLSLIQFIRQVINLFL
jgi:hypothetical protein